MPSGEIALERTNAGVAVLTITGEHDLSTAPSLGRRLKGLIGDRSPIVVDLSPATFIDSSILAAILEARRRADSVSLGFAVANSGRTEVVRLVLEVTGLRATLPVHGGREEALAAAASAAGSSG